MCVDVLDERFGFELVAVAHQIPGLFHGCSKTLVEIEFPQADYSVSQRTVCTVCHRCYQYNLVEPFMEDKVYVDPIKSGTVLNNNAAFVPYNI